MSDPQQTPSQQPADMSPEEREAAAFATDADALAQAQAKLATLQAKSAELADQFLRAKAEAENARRRAEEEITKARKFAVEAFAESLLPVADSLEAGLAHKDGTAEQVREGAEATLRQLVSALAPSSIRTSTRPSAWCRPNRRPTPWSRCCKRATRSPSACCAPPWSPWPRRNESEGLKAAHLSTTSQHPNSRKSQE
jgi:hypothetical protein